MTEFRDFYQTVHDTADTLRKGNLNEGDIKIIIDILDKVSEIARKYVTDLSDVIADGIIEGAPIEVLLPAQQAFRESLEKSQYLNNYAKEYISATYKLTFEEIVYGEGEEEAYLIKMAEIVNKHNEAKKHGE